LAESVVADEETAARAHKLLAVIEEREFDWRARGVSRCALKRGARRGCGWWGGGRNGCVTLSIRE
jgi:hypothetical protein